MTRASTQAIYDQLLAKLRDAQGFPLSTAELTEGVHVIERRAPSVQPQGHLWHDTEVLSEPTVTGVYVLRRPAFDWEIYPRLRQLEARGLVTRLRVSSSKRVYWQPLTLNDVMAPTEADLKS